MRDPRVTLSDYVAAHPTSPTGPRAWLTTLPEWPTILEAWESGIATAGQIRGWLINECGYSPLEVTFAKVGGYLTKHHPRRVNGQS
jgi:hypothetical protein